MSKRNKLSILKALCSPYLLNTSCKYAEFKLLFNTQVVNFNINTSTTLLLLHSFSLVDTFTPCVHMNASTRARSPHMFTNTRAKKYKQGTSHELLSSGICLLSSMIIFLLQTLSFTLTIMLMHYSKQLLNANKNKCNTSKWSCSNCTCSKIFNAPEHIPLHLALNETNVI